MFDADLLAGVNDLDVYGFITVVGNGILFVGLMAYKRIGYRALFHPAGHSVAATMTLVIAADPDDGARTRVPRRRRQHDRAVAVPNDADDVARFEQMMAPGIVPLLFSCIAAPVLEEMLFRGVILRGFLRQYSRTFAILWSAALFGIAHLNLYQFVTAFVDRHRRRVGSTSGAIAVAVHPAARELQQLRHVATTRGCSRGRTQSRWDPASRFSAPRSLGCSSAGCSCSGCLALRRPPQIQIHDGEDARGARSRALFRCRQHRQIRRNACDLIAAVGAQAHAIRNAKREMRVR